MTDFATQTASRIRVGSHPEYDVVVGTGLVAEVPALLAGATRVAVIHSGSVAAYAQDLVARLTTAGYETHAIEVPDGERAKDLSVASFCWSVLGQMRLTRSDVVLGVGGGATTDLAGFVAATWLRGVRAVFMPTTLLGMVDAAIGGKTAINSDAGKNMVGAFHAPVGVFCDVATLHTLPPPEYVSGLAEVIKAGFIADPVILELIESDPVAATSPGGQHTRELIERSIAVKANVVAADFTERGGREVLNYGHTLGHAIEHVDDYRWRHGSAVAVGLCFAAELSRLSRGLDDATVARHRALLQAVGLPTTYRRDAWPRLLDAMRVDKKARGDRLRFVVLDSLARPSLLEDPDLEMVEAAYLAVSQ